MSDEEGEEEGKGPKSLKKGGVPAKCYGGAPKREGSLIKGAFMCKTPGTARPTAIFQCMNTPRRDGTRHPQAAPPCGDPLGLVDSRGPDHFPPQGGMLTKTCGVKAQFVGEIVIKKDIPPRIQGCGGEDCAIKTPQINAPPQEGSSPPPNPPCARPISPAHHHQAPICCVPCTPCQPEISEDCRRALRRCGPDSSRCHPEGMFGELEEKLCGGADYCAERPLHPGEEERYESTRTREEVTMDPCDPRRCNMLGGCDCCSGDAKYVRVEDTFRRQRQYSPPVEAMAPPISYPCVSPHPTSPDPCTPCLTPPCVPGLPPCGPPCPQPPCPIPCSPPCPAPCIPPVPPREPYGVYPPPSNATNWNAPPYYADKPCDPTWADVHYNPLNEYEPTRCRPDCWNNPYQPYAEYKPPYMPNSPEYMNRPECELQCRIPTVM